MIVYGDNEMLAVADWEHATEGVRIWKRRIAQVSPDAGAPADLTLTRIINDIRGALEVGKMQLIVTK